jgi:fermentation-respiration switch protein FrsA (DUF1100 family)
MAERSDVEFNATDGTRLSAWLFRPTDAGDGPFPAVTMAHGFTATKFHGVEPIARAIADAGFVVLLHDHRGFGASGGVPRNDIDPWRQIEDWRQAISFLETLPDVDRSRIGLWGTSFAGGHALVLGATDRRIKAVVSQVPTIDGYISGQRRVPASAVGALEESFNEDLRGQLRGEPPRTQRVVALDPDVPAAYRGKDAVDFLEQPVPDGMWQNEITIQSSRRARMYQPGLWVDRISPTPLLMIVGDNDTTTPSDLALAAYEHALDPKALVVIPGGHYAAYTDAFDEASKAAVDWFATHLASRP